MSRLSSLGKYFVTVFRREPWWVEFLSAIVIIGWVLLNFTTSEKLAGDRNFFLITKIAPQQFWLMLGFSLGLSQAILCLLNHMVGRWVLACLCAWWWLFLVCGVFLATTPVVPPGLATYGGYALANLLSVVRIFPNSARLFLNSLAKGVSKTISSRTG